MIIAAFVLMLVGLIGFIGCCAASSQAARRLVDFQFRHHREDWLRDGRPVGGSVTRPELSFFGSDFATILALPNWAVRRPDWLPIGSEGERDRIAMVRWGLYSLIGFAVAVAGGFVFFRELIHAA